VYIKGKEHGVKGKEHGAELEDGMLLPEFIRV
jgi:hypothetical protein